MFFDLIQYFIGIFENALARVFPVGNATPTLNDTAGSPSVGSESS